MGLEMLEFGPLESFCLVEASFTKHEMVLICLEKQGPFNICIRTEYGVCLYVLRAPNV